MATGTIEPISNDDATHTQPRTRHSAMHGAPNLTQGDLTRGDLTQGDLARAAAAGAILAVLTVLLSGQPRLAVAIGFANILLSLVLDRFKTRLR